LTNTYFPDGRKKYFDDTAFPNDTDFPFGANAPQDSQDFHDPNDSHDSYDSHDSKEAISALAKHLDRAAGNHPPPGTPLSLPIRKYVRKALEFSEQERRERAEDKWSSPVFPFARFCKAHPAIKALPDDKAARAVEEVMLTWDDLPKSRCPWEHYFPDAGGTDAARLDFMVSWDSIRHVPFDDPLRNALRLADEKPLKPPYFRGELYQRFVSLAGWLQVLTKEKSIFLPTRTIGELLGCDPTSVSRLRRLAVRDELLIEVKRHRFRSSGKSEATEFRFHVDRFDELGGKP
jgi:hypothetical protein